MKNFVWLRDEHLIFIAVENVTYISIAYALANVQIACILGRRRESPLTHEWIRFLKYRYY